MNDIKQQLKIDLQNRLMTNTSTANSTQEIPDKTNNPQNKLGLFTKLLDKIQTTKNFVTNKEEWQSTGDGWEQKKATLYDKLSNRMSIRKEENTPSDSMIEKYSLLKEKTPYTGQFTMYNPEERQTDDTPYILASGKHIDVAKKEAKEKGFDGILATGFRALPLGTIVRIPELNKTLVVEDRMNEKYNLVGDYRFDLISDSKQDAKQFGRKDLSFQIVGHDGRENTKIDTKVLRAAGLYKPQ